MTDAPAMTDTRAATPAVYGYHVHVYYDAATRTAARSLHERLAADFPVEMGRFSDDPIGPHPVSQFQVIFKTDTFQNIVSWLMFNRQGLSILVHPLTDDMVDDHDIYALWLGTPIKLRLDTMKRRGYPTTLLPTAA
jgi:DOPA 4,5-dioxygenase